MLISNIKYVYFIGVGGIGMSAIARWFNANGYSVLGYDKTETRLTQQLAQEGIKIHYCDDIVSVLAAFKLEKSNTLVIFTPAVPDTHQELQFFRKNGFSIIKRAKALGQIASQMYTVAIAGTHGKTTTSSMIAHILRFAKRDSAAFLGGISTNYESNLLLNKKVSKQTPVVVEADEFDRSFLQLYPHLAVITSTDADHLDIYGSRERLIQSFADFIKQIQEEGKLFVCKEALKSIPKSSNNIDVVTYSASEKADIYADNIRVESGCFVFDCLYEKETDILGISLPLPGLHNVENALAAIALAIDLGIDKKVIRDAFMCYKGVKRRFEQVLKTEKSIYIDDYAHHPTEIRACLRAVKKLYPTKQITAIFQPHLYSRTRDFQDEFAQSLSLADVIILLDIYPARERPIQGVTSKIIFDKIKNKNKYLLRDELLLGWIEQHKPEVLLTMGAGNIDVFVPKIKSLLSISC